MIYVFDLDGTLCKTPVREGRNCYEAAEPLVERIALVNELVEAGHKVIIDSARGCDSGKNWLGLTVQQLREWGVRYDQVRTGVKFGGDVYVDDRAWDAGEFFDEGRWAACRGS